MAGILERALVAAESASPDELTHGFHSYPARMHPAIARTVLSELAELQTRVLDPFCGSGTVLIESFAKGLRATGVDLSELAVRLARVKTMRPDADRRARFVARAHDIAVRSEERVRGRVNSRAPVAPAEARRYDGHVLKELGGLREEILVVDNEEDREAFLFVLSSMVVKFSRQRADTSDEQVAKRIRKGIPTEFFYKKSVELARRWQALDELSPPDAKAPTIVLGDARRLPELVGQNARFGLVLSSPPYGGTYDYVAHHARRYPWLGISAGALVTREIGSRRQLGTDPEARRRWDADTEQYLRAMSAVLASEGRILLLLGDAQVAGERIEADHHLEAHAPRAGLEVVAVASQRRPDFTGGRARSEHLVMLTKRPAR